MSLRRAFLSSPHHAVMALATVGAGVASGEPLYLIAGAAAYVLGWVYVPDLPIFRRWRERKENAQLEASTKDELATFRAKRDALLDSLTSTRRQRYHTLAAVCRDIERATAEDPDDVRVRKLEELMWTFLRLLTIDQSLDEFLESEAREDVPRLLADAEQEVASLTHELAALRAAGADVQAKERLLNSRRELLETVAKRHQRLEEAKNNLALVSAEQERLDQQIKLIRADAIATRNAGALSARIDATVDHLEATNQWLSQMDQFRDLLTDLPSSGARLGFGGPVTSTPPPLPTRSPVRGRQQ